jgi:hypothetical protein
MEALSSCGTSVLTRAKQTSQKTPFWILFIFYVDTVEPGAPLLRPVIAIVADLDDRW